MSFCTSSKSMLLSLPHSPPPPPHFLSSFLPRLHLPHLLPPYSFLLITLDNLKCSVHSSFPASIPFLFLLLLHSLIALQNSLILLLLFNLRFFLSYSSSFFSFLISLNLFPSFNPPSSFLDLTYIFKDLSLPSLPLIFLISFNSPSPYFLHCFCQYFPSLLRSFNLPLFLIPLPFSSSCSLSRTHFYVPPQPILFYFLALFPLSECSLIPFLSI